MAKTVDTYIEYHARWTDELKKLRVILVSTGLTETMKWGMPSYGAHGQNIVGVGAFKNHFGLWFHQGALLTDKDGVLMNAQEGKTKAMRQWRMSSMRDIKPAIIKRFIKEAVAKAAAGETTKPDRKRAVRMPAALGSALNANKNAAAAFKALTPGKRRAYAEYIAEAKRPETKQRRVDKILPMIAAGMGLNDRYKC